MSDTVQREGVRPADDVPVRIVPRRSLIVTGAIAFALANVPVFGALYWVGLEGDHVLPVIVLHVLVLAAGAAVLARQLTIDTVVDGVEISGRGIFSPMVRVPLDRIARVDLVPIYLTQANEPHTQLLARDAGGRRLYRLRGTFWHDEDLDRVAAALPVPAERAAEPMSATEFFQNYPGSAYWFENRPVAMGALLVGGVLVISGAALLLLSALGVPTGMPLG